MTRNHKIESKSPIDAPRQSPPTETPSKLIETLDPYFGVILIGGGLVGAFAFYQFFSDSGWVVAAGFILGFIVAFFATMFFSIWIANRQVQAEENLTHERPAAPAHCLKERINDDLKQAMRDKQQARIDTLRLLTAAIKQREVDERVTLDDTQVQAVIDKLVKRARESIEQYEKGGRSDLVAKEQADMAIWQTYVRTSEQIERPPLEELPAKNLRIPPMNNNPKELMVRAIKSFNTAMQRMRTKSTDDPCPEIWEDVIHELTGIVKTNAYNERALYMRARAYYFSGKHMEAIHDLDAFFSEGHRYDPIVHGDLSPLTLRAMAKIELKQYPDAESDLLTEIKLLGKTMEDRSIRRSREYYWLLVCRYQGNRDAATEEQSKLY